MYAANIGHSEANPSQEEKENRQHHTLHHANLQVDQRPYQYRETIPVQRDRTSTEIPYQCRETSTISFFIMKLEDKIQLFQFLGELGSSRRSFRKSSRKSQPIREEEEEEFLGQMAFSDEERQQGVPSRDRPEPEVLHIVWPRIVGNTGKTLGLRLVYGAAFCG
ncbi:unnamed protein product [Boreogadus saida]